MNNTDKTALMPKLRFPEFLTAEGWQVAPLSQLATRTKKKNRDQTITRVLTNSAEFGVVDQRDFFDKDIATQGNLESYFVVDLGSYVYNPRISATAPVGPISKNKVGTGVMSPLYTVFKFENDSNEFYEHYFKTTGWHTYMRQASSTGARHDRMAISSDDFMAMPLPVSSPAEQQKIADCLSSLDELIAAQARKVDALKTHKKGLMQQLFPREGETQPRLRFPDFRDMEEWEKNALGKLVEIRSGSSPSEHELHTDGKYPFVKVEDLNNCKKYQSEARGYSNETGGLVPRNSVIFPKRGAAIALNKLRLTDRELLMDTNMMALTPSDVCYADFLFHYLSQIGLDSIADNSTIPQINNKHIIPFCVLIPVPQEQQRISDCLNSLDALITTAAQELETLKTYKKGLMQQLFPSTQGQVLEA